MARYKEEFKLRVVEQYISGLWSLSELSTRHKLDSATIRSWVASYRHHGPSGVRKKFSHYSAQFKLSVLQRMWREGLSRRQTTALFDLRGGTGVVAAWERQYHGGGLDALKPKPRGRPKTMTTPSPKPVSAGSPPVFNGIQR
jgi:transposase